MVNIDEMTKADLEPQLASFENKIDQLKEKANKLLEIVQYFDQVKGKFQEGAYKEMILGELERN